MNGTRRFVFTAASLLALAQGCDDGIGDDPEYRQYALETESDGSTGWSTGGYDSSTSDSSSSTTGWWDLGTGGWTSSTTGPYCVVEEPEECCIAACDSGTPKPVPGGPTNFDCPVADMEYNCGCPGTDLFDCDDFAYACENWGKNQGYNICTYSFGWTMPNGTSSGHAINVVEFEYDGPNAKYCFIEPQNNQSLGCWIQPEGDPEPPEWAKDNLCQSMGGTCSRDDLFCDAEHSPNAGEVCFNTLPAVCSTFRMKTGLCPYTFEKDHDCFDLDASGDPCYWSCNDDQVCGAVCNDCDPAPASGTTGGP